MKKFLNIDDLRQLIKNIKSEFSKYSKKTDVPTKITDLVDDTLPAGPNVAYAEHSNFSEEAGVAYNAIADQEGNDIIATYATKTELGTVESIAKGRATGYVFDTIEDMNIWLASDQQETPYPNTDLLKLGDNLYIRETDVPDYWWDGSSAQPLETQKVDLTEYAQMKDVPQNISSLNDDTEIKPINKAEEAVSAIKDNLGNPIHETYATKAEIGDVETALDGIIIIQNQLMGVSE